MRAALSHSGAFGAVAHHAEHTLRQLLGAETCPCLQGARGEAIERKYSPTRVSIRENDVSGAATQETLKL